MWKNSRAMESAPANQRGVTLVELTVTLAISAILGLVFSLAQSYIARFTLLSKAKQITVQESRTALSVMQKMLQQASASTIVIDQLAGQAPYSRIYFHFTDSQNQTKEFYFYQTDRVLYMDYRPLGASAWNQKILSKNVRFVSFFYPDSSDNRLISLTLTVAKQTAEQKETFLQLSLQKIRIMNP